MKYPVILADPPWHMDCTPRVAAAKHYHGTMCVDEICALPIRAQAEKNAALFLWVPMGNMPEAFDVMRAWGFAYRGCAFTWVKINKSGSPFMGLGNYTRNNAELCLLGVRGSMPRKARNVSQILLAGRREHSRKPDQQYGRIMRLFDGPYLELFARQQWPGWDVWGNQTSLFPAQPFLFDEGWAA